MKLLLGDCIEIMKTLPDNSVDSVVTDPPYGLEFMGKEWDKLWVKGEHGQQGRIDGMGGMETWGKRPQYVGGKQAQDWHYNWAKEVYRVLKPGGYILSFGGSRTYHRMACAIEDAGFEIRDMIEWMYGSGFPKSHDVSKGIDKMAGAKRTLSGFYESPEHTTGWKGQNKVNIDFGASRYEDGERRPITSPATESAKQWSGWGTALKPSHEPICMARKPLSESTVAANVLKWGTGGINVDGCRIGTNSWNRPTTANIRGGNYGNSKGEEKKPRSCDQGRFPANLIHDGSDEVMEMFPNVRSGTAVNRKRGKRIPSTVNYANHNEVDVGYNDSGSAARFFYCSKCSKSDRQGSTHPTMKPTTLMRYLCKLVTPPNGIVLDPFMGSGSTGKAAKLEGFDFIGIEMNDEYLKIAEARIASVKVSKSLFPDTIS